MQCFILRAEEDVLIVDHSTYLGWEKKILVI